MKTEWEKEWLKNEFRRRQSANPQYSLRAFSRATQIYPGRLSEYISGTRKLSPKVAQKIALRLGIPPAKLGSLFPRKPPEFSALDSEAFTVIADWVHFALLSLMETKSFQPSELWISRRLGILALTARDALDRLVRLGLVERNGKKLKLTRRNLTTTHEIESQALKKSHTQSLEQVITALTEVPLNLRDITSVTMAIDTTKLELAKNLIRDFRRELMSVLENENADEVYNLNIQLVPVTKIKKGNQK